MLLSNVRRKNCGLSFIVRITPNLRATLYPCSSPTMVSYRNITCMNILELSFFVDALFHQVLASRNCFLAIVVAMIFIIV